MKGAANTKHAVFTPIYAVDALNPMSIAALTVKFVRAGRLRHFLLFTVVL